MSNQNKLLLIQNKVLNVSGEKRPDAVYPKINKIIDFLFPAPRSINKNK